MRKKCVGTATRLAPIDTACVAIRPRLSRKAVPLITYTSALFAASSRVALSTANQVRRFTNGVCGVTAVK